MLIDRTCMGLVLGMFQHATGEIELGFPNARVFHCGFVENGAITEGQISFLYGPFEDTYRNTRRKVYASIMWDIETNEVVYELLDSGHHRLRMLKRDEFLILVNFAPAVQARAFWDACEAEVVHVVHRMLIPYFEDRDGHT